MNLFSRLAGIMYFKLDIWADYKEQTKVDDMAIMAGYIAHKKPDLLISNCNANSRC